MRHLIISGIVGAGLLTGSAGLSYAQYQYDEFNSTDTQSMQSKDTASGGLSLMSRQHVNFNQLPAGVRRSIRAQAGEAPIKAVDKGTWRGTAYQVSFNRNGSPVELQVAENGTILNGNARNQAKVALSNVQELTYDQLPPAVQDVISQRAGAAQIESIEQGTWRGTVYEAQVNKPGMSRILVAEDGSLLRQPAFSESAGAQAGAQGGAQHQGMTREFRGGTEMAFKDLPWPVQKSMLDRSGSAHIETVRKITLADGRTVYHAVFPKDNKRHAISVAQDGTVVSERDLGAGRSESNLQPLSAATKVSFSDLPAAAQRAAKSRIGSTRIEDIDKGTLNGQTVYELAYKKDGRTAELRVTADGKILGEHFD